MLNSSVININGNSGVLVHDHLEDDTLLTKISFIVSVH